MNNTKSVAIWLVPGFVVGLALYLVFIPPEYNQDKKHQSLKDRVFRSLDWRGGTRLEYKMNPEDATQKGLVNPAARRKALKQAQRVFLFRLRNFDLTENDVRTLGDDTIIVEVPKTEGIENAIYRTGVVSFREVLSDGVAEQTIPEAERQGWFCYKDVKDGPTTNYYYQLDTKFIGAEDIDYGETKAELLDSDAGLHAGEWVVELNWQSDSRAKAVTELDKRYQKNIAICVDQDIQTIAIVQDKHLDQAMITGMASQLEAIELANVLAGGYLPVSFDLQNRTSIGPRFGAALQERALVVTEVAVLFIFILLLLRCNDNMPILGISILSIALCAGSFFYLILSGTTTLSAATLCAFVALASMAVDNLILVFEEFRRRQRKEKQKKLLSARDIAPLLIEAYESEKYIIFLANASTALMIGSLYFANGPIQDLVIATCLGLAVTWLTTVWYPRCLYGSKRLLYFLDQFNLAINPLLDISGNIFASSIRKYMVVVYLAVLIGSTVFIATHGIQIGLDLQGGHEIVVSSNVGLDIEKVRLSADKYFDRACTVVSLNDTPEGTSNYRYAIRVPGGDLLDIRRLVATGDDSAPLSAPNVATFNADKYIAFLKNVTEVDSISMENTQTIGGMELALNMTKLFVCVGVAFILLAILIQGVYGRASAIYSIAAMFTDGIITLGAVSYFQVALTVPVIAAILTVIGFSLYDSMVLCGHLNQAWKRRENLVHALEPLSTRLVLISTATGGASIGLWIFGLGIIKDFGVVLTTGVVFGLMSSITIVAFGVMHSLRRRIAPEPEQLPKRTAL